MHQRYFDHKTLQLLCCSPVGCCNSWVALCVPEVLPACLSHLRDTSGRTLNVLSITLFSSAADDCQTLVSAWQLCWPVWESQTKLRPPLQRGLLLDKQQVKMQQRMNADKRFCCLTPKLLTSMLSVSCLSHPQLHAVCLCTKLHGCQCQFQCDAPII